MSRLIDITGWIMSEHGVPDSRLVVIERAESHITPNGSIIIMWKCKCLCKKDSPNFIIVDSQSIRNGRIKSCGCYHKEIISNIGKKTGKVNGKLHKKYNDYNLMGEYGIGYTLKGEEFWFDLEDYDKIKDYCWSYGPGGYVESQESGSKKKIRLHCLVMGSPNSKIYVVDHKEHPPRNGHKMDNRKQNLQIVTRSQNNMNRSIQNNNTSGVTGVWYDKRRNKWCAELMIYNEKKYLGSFVNFDDAVSARKDAEIKYFGEYRFDTYKINNTK